MALCVQSTILKLPWRFVPSPLQAQKGRGGPKTTSDVGDPKAAQTSREGADCDLRGEAPVLRHIVARSGGAARRVIGPCLTSGSAKVGRARPSISGKTLVPQ